MSTGFVNRFCNLFIIFVYCALFMFYFFINSAQYYCLIIRLISFHADHIPGCLSEHCPVEAALCPAAGLLHRKHVLARCAILCFQIVAGKHDVLRRLIALKSAQIHRQLHILFQVSVYGKYGQLLLLLIKDSHPQDIADLPMLLRSMDWAVCQELQHCAPPVSGSVKKWIVDSLSPGSAVRLCHHRRDDIDKLSQAGARLCVKVLKDLEEGKAVREKQPEESTTAYASMISKKMGEINWEDSAKSIEQLIRGLNPWPSAYTKLQGKTLKLWRARVEENQDKEGEPGQIIRIEKEAFYVKTGDGILKIEELQLEGKKRMDTGAFLRGFPLSAGEILG